VSVRKLTPVRLKDQIIETVLFKEIKPYKQIGYLMYTFFTTSALVFTLIVSSLPTSSVPTKVSQAVLQSPQAQDTFIRKKMREHIGQDPLMEIIAGCESTGNPRLIKHWNADGTLLKNPTSSASGSAQVLLKYHSDWIQSAGKNMKNIDEYWEFVDILLEAQGYGAWNPSRHCWGKYRDLGTN